MGCNHCPSWTWERRRQGVCTKNCASKKIAPAATTKVANDKLVLDRAQGDIFDPRQHTATLNVLQQNEAKRSCSAPSSSKDLGRVCNVRVSHTNRQRSSGLNSTGGAINPDKSRWILAAYEWINGIWRYRQQPEVNMTIPLPDGTRAPISPGHVTTAEKSLGVWSAIDGNDSKHIEENVTGKTRNWINQMRNAHLPVRMGWIAYKFKLWAGI